jgi:hypothetical protein
LFTVSRYPGLPRENRDVCRSAVDVDEVLIEQRVGAVAFDLVVA